MSQVHSCAQALYNAIVADSDHLFLLALASCTAADMLFQDKTTGQTPLHLCVSRMKLTWVQRILWVTA